MKAPTVLAQGVSSVLLAAFFGFLAINPAKAQIIFDFAANLDSTIQFNGAAHSFQFDSPVSGSQWQITDQPFGPGDAVGLEGSVTGGPFTYGTVSGGLVQTADVTGPTGVFTINDGSGHNLTGSIDFMTVDTFFSSGVLDGDLAIDLTKLSYSGSNAALEALVADQPGVLALSFQFATSDNLTTLSEGSSPSGYTSYSGSISEIPEPSTYAILMGGFALLGLWAIRRKLA